MIVGLGKFGRAYTAWRAKRCQRSYLEEHASLRNVIAEVDAASDSCGADVGDYVALYEVIRSRRPRFVLECGTGRSTWAIAQAMLDHVDGSRDGEMKLVSMEHGQEWADHQKQRLPERFRGFVEVVHSPMDIWGYSFLRGACYKEVPEHPYEFAFVDGPFQDAGTGETMCDIDFLRVVSKSDRPVSALVDNRKHSVLAYTIALGREKVRYNQVWGLGTVEPVTKKDLRLLDKRVMRASVFTQAVRRSSHKPFKFGS